MSGENGDGGQDPQKQNPNGDPKNPDPQNPNPQGGDGGGDGDGGDKTQKTVPHEALHSEREKRKAAEAELAEFRKREAEREEEEAKKRGEHEKLYETEKSKREELEKQLAEKDEKIKSFEERAQASIDKMLGQIKDEKDRAMVGDLLDGKPLEKQEELLPDLLEKFGLPNTINHSPKGGGNADTSNSEIDKKIDALEQEKVKAKEKKDATRIMKINRQIDELKSKKS